MATPEEVTIPVGGKGGIGDLRIPPPTFLEKWGVVFVSVGGAWILLMCIAFARYYMAHLALPPTQAMGVKAEDYNALLDGYKSATGEFRDSVGFVFDLMVTKTVLPLLTLLLGYLFGSKKG